VVNGTTYYYAVTAVSIFTGESTFMNVVSATPCVNLVQNGGFETGFTGWSFSGDYCNTFLDYLGQAGIPPHSGNWEVDLGTCDSDYGYLSQTLATTPGAIYLISFWVNNSFGDPNEFLVSWNGANVFGPTNLSLFATTWTNIQIQVTATNASTVLQFGFEDDYDVLGLDDVSVGLSASLTSPPAPAGLQAVPDDGQVTLTWNASPGALYYLVASGTNSGGEITYVVTFVTNYMDTNVVNGIKYYYKVLAENNSGLAYTSSEVSATPGVVAVPPAPTGLQAAATNGQVTLSWTASPHATYYLVARSTSSGTETSIMGIMTTNYTDTSVVNGTKYYYVVVSGNNLGAAYASSEVNATPVGTAVPSAPKLGGITFAGGGGGGCGFCFTNVPGASFYVYASVDLTQPFTNWTKVGTVSEVPYGAYSQYQFTDPQATTNVQRFYRVSSQ
jgi:hypothetical protein